MLLVYGHEKYFNSFSAGTVFIRQNLTSTDIGFWSLKTVPALKGSHVVLVTHPVANGKIWRQAVLISHFLYIFLATLTDSTSSNHGNLGVSLKKTLHFFK